MENHGLSFSMRGTRFYHSYSGWSPNFAIRELEQKHQWKGFTFATPAFNRIFPGISKLPPHQQAQLSLNVPPPHFPQLFFSSVVHGGGSVSLGVRAGVLGRGSTFHSTGTAAWVATAADCVSSLPEPRAAQSPWGLPVHNPAFSHHGNGMLLKNGLCFPFAFLSNWGIFCHSCSFFLS